MKNTTKNRLFKFSRDLLISTINLALFFVIFFEKNEEDSTICLNLDDLETKTPAILIGLGFLMLLKMLLDEKYEDKDNEK